MSIEIELKAHINDVEAVKRLLYKKAVFLWGFEKDDTYWSGETSGEMPPFRTRLRREKRTLSDGSVKSSFFVTYKTKETHDGIEINEEKEFEVSFKNPPDKESVFEEFLRRMGLEPEISKRKRGWAFNKNGITAELCDVEGLGWFVELEILADENLINKEEIYSTSKNRLLDLLESLGIEKNAIESRYYTEMLWELKKTV